MAVYGVCCLLGDAPPVPAKWSQPNKFRSVQQLCRGATSLQNVVSAAHGSPVLPSTSMCAAPGKRSEKAFSARLRGRPQSALWKTLFRDGKLVGVDDGKVDSNVQEKELGLQFLRDGDINQGSTANFNPYHQTLHGAQHCPHFQGIRDSGTRFHHPQGRPGCVRDPTFALQIPGEVGVDLGHRLRTCKTPFPKRPATSMGLTQEGVSPRKAGTDITTFPLAIRTTSEEYAYKSIFKRTRGKDANVPAYLLKHSSNDGKPEVAYNRCPSDLHNYYEHRRVKPVVNDLRMFGPPLDMMAYKEVHWGDRKSVV